MPWLADACRGGKDKMRPENKAMSEYLAREGLLNGVTVKYIVKGSLAGCWRLCMRSAIPGKLFETWNEQDATTLNRLGFLGFDGKPLYKFSGNGGMWQVFVCGHYELLKANAGGEGRAVAHTVQPLVGSSESERK